MYQYTLYLLELRFRPAIPAIAGLQVGLLGQLTVIGIGLGTIFATSPSGFLILQWAGVLYLVWIGVSKLIWPE